MGLEAKYRSYHDGRWNLWVLSERWSEELWSEIKHCLSCQPSADHPQTVRLHYPAGERGAEFYLKIYDPAGPAGRFKDLFRVSKARRSLSQGRALSELGFHVPLGVAAGEERTFRLLKRSFLLTLGIRGSSLPLFLRERYLLPDIIKKKRQYLEQLALEIRGLHECGFLHGDLVPSNILLQSEEGKITFFYMDNDRTRSYPPWFPRSFWKRNLVQLNRFVLPGISLQDRMRFLRFYLRRRRWRRSDRRLIRWLEKKTRARRRECDRIEARVSFRELMRWNGPFAKNIP